MSIVTIVLIVLLIISIVSCIVQFKTKSKESVNIKEYPNFLTDEECDMIIALSKDNLTDSTVYTETENVINNSHRRSKQAWLYDNQNALIKSVSEKVAKLTNIPIENQEPLQVVKYESGGFFNPHYDACDGDANFCKRLNGLSGARRITLLIYLNDEFTGGETIFPNVPYTAIPKKGKAVMFTGTNDKDQIIEESYHGGNPVKSGVKWVCNKWIRPFKYVLP
jgi:prolyl 4-hydroxylase